jgi:peptide/nickel transport system ATP-binding protein
MIQAQVLDLLVGLIRDLDLGLILISHDLSVLATTCDEVAVMYAGRVVERARQRDAFTDPRHPYSAALAAAFPTVGDESSRRAPTGLSGDPPDPTDLPTGCTFHPRCPIAVPACARLDPALRSAGPARAAACLRVGADGRRLEPEEVA